MIAFLRRRLRRFALLALPLCFVASVGCAPLMSIFETEDDSGPSPILLIALYFLLNQSTSDSCDSVASPNAGSAQYAGAIASGAGAITGKFQTQAGAGVVGAVVMLDDLSTSNSVHYSTHSSVNRDGTFTIAGVPSGSYRLAIEGLNTNSFSGRIDTHLNCYLTPRSFTSGWYNGSGDTITTSAPGSLGLTIPSASTLDIGTIKLLD